MSRSRAAKRTHVGMDLYPVRVRRVVRLTPHLNRITLAGPSLAGFRDDGPDQRFKLLLPQPGQVRPTPLEVARWYQHWLELPADVRPIMRTYTIRHARPVAAEVDVDVVLHSPAGPASRWAASTTPGDEVALFGAWAEYELEPEVEWQLLAGDHAALPAIAAIVDRLPAAARGQVLIELSDLADCVPLAVPAGVEVQWVRAIPGQPGVELQAAVAALPPQVGLGYAWIAGESDTVRALRRQLIGDRGLMAEQIMFMGYWRAGGAIDDA